MSLTFWKCIVLRFRLLLAFCRNSITALSLDRCLGFHNMPCSVHFATFIRPVAPFPPSAVYWLAGAHGFASLCLRPTRARLRQAITARLLYHNLTIMWTGKIGRCESRQDIISQAVYMYCGQFSFDNNLKNKKKNTYTDVNTGSVCKVV